MLFRSTHSGPGTLSRRIDHATAAAPFAEQFRVGDRIRNVSGFIDNQGFREHAVMVLPEGTGQDRGIVVDLQEPAPDSGAAIREPS